MTYINAMQANMPTRPWLPHLKAISEQPRYRSHGVLLDMAAQPQHFINTEAVVNKLRSTSALFGISTDIGLPNAATLSTADIGALHKHLTPTMKKERAGKGRIRTVEESYNLMTSDVFTIHDRFTGEHHRIGAETQLHQRIVGLMQMLAQWRALSPERYARAMLGTPLVGIASTAVIEDFLRSVGDDEPIDSYISGDNEEILSQEARGGSVRKDIKLDRRESAVLAAQFLLGAKLSHLFELRGDLYGIRQYIAESVVNTAVNATLSELA